MIVLNVTYKCKPDMRDAFLERIMAEGIGEACRAEEGNIKYDYYYPADDSDDLLLVETWTEPALQQAHCATEIFARLQALKADVTEDEIVFLLSFPEDSPEADMSVALADRIMRERCDNTGDIGVQIGVITGPCVGRCRFCNFSADTTDAEPYVMPDDVLRDYVREVTSSATSPASRC